MLQLHEMKVIILTTGGITDVRKVIGSMANNCREKSAEVIVEVDTNLKKTKKLGELKKFE